METLERICQSRRDDRPVASPYLIRLELDGHLYFEAVNLRHERVPVLVQPRRREVARHIRRSRRHNRIPGRRHGNAARTEPERFRANNRLRVRGCNIHRAIEFQPFDNAISVGHIVCRCVTAVSGAVPDDDIDIREWTVVVGPIIAIIPVDVPIDYGDIGTQRSSGENHRRENRERNELLHRY